MESKPSDNPIFIVAIFLFLIFFLLLPALYNHNRIFFNTVFLEMSLFNIGFFTHFSPKALENYRTIQAMTPQELGWEEISIVLYYSGTWARYPFMILLALMGFVAIFFSNKNQLYRRFSMKVLSEHNAEHFPCIAPVVGKGEYLQTIESFDRGRWQIARTPVQFCVEKELAHDTEGNSIVWEDAFKNGVADAQLPAYGKMILDKAKFEKIFIEQLGHKMKSFKDLSILRQSIVASFFAFGNGDKQTAINILDTCSLSYIENDKEMTCKCFADKAFRKYVQDTYTKYTKISSKLLEKHNTYELTWIMALLFFARKKGILAPSQFLFVRPLDRSLWYALHQCGGQVAWAEGLSAWLHYHAEEKEEKTLENFNWQNAYSFIEMALITQGWLDMALIKEIELGTDITQEKGGVSIE